MVDHESDKMIMIREWLTMNKNQMTRDRSWDEYVILNHRPGQNGQGMIMVDRESDTNDHQWVMHVDQTIDQLTMDK